MSNAKQRVEEFTPMPCWHYNYQRDANYEIVISHCSHEGNPDKYEGNCSQEKCPLCQI